MKETSKQMVIEELNRQKKFYRSYIIKFGMSKAEAKKYIDELNRILTDIDEEWDDE